MTDEETEALRQNVEDFKNLGSIPASEVNDLFDELISLGVTLAVFLTALKMIFMENYNKYKNIASDLQKDYYNYFRNKKVGETVNFGTYTPVSVNADKYVNDWFDYSVCSVNKKIEKIEFNEKMLVSDIELATLLDEHFKKNLPQIMLGGYQNMAADMLMSLGENDDNFVGVKRIARPGACKYCIRMAEIDPFRLYYHKNCGCGKNPIFVTF